MNVRKVVAGSVLAAALGAAGMFGAGTALAGPGVSFDPGTGGTKPIGIGDQTATGAYANAAPGNSALAVNLISPVGSKATAVGTNNNVFAFDGQSVVAHPGAKDNNVATAFGATVVTGAAQRNTVVNAGSVNIVGGGAENQTSVSLCGTRLSAQSSHITVGTVTGGLC
jgi:hypothetical protein